MEAGRLERVRIDVAGNVVEISWDERDWLLAKIAAVHGYQSILAKFHDGDGSQPLELDVDERARLQASLELWEPELRDGLERLLAALAHAAPRTADDT